MKKKIFSVLLTLMLVLSFSLVPMTPAMAATEVWVDAANTTSPWNGTVADPYQTIQDGIDAVDPSGTVNVAAGTYEEAVIIDKSLTLLGAKSGVDAWTRDTSSGESILDGTNLTAGKSGFFIGGGVSDVIIDGFEIRNYASASAGTGNAISAWQSVGTSNIQVLNNYMHDLGWNGILVGNEGQAVHSNWLVEANIVDGFGAYGIELTNTTESTIRRNKVIGNGGYRAIMVLAIFGAWTWDPEVEPDGIAVSGNIIENNEISGTLVQVGINVGAMDWQGKTATNSLTIVRNNKVEGAPIGISMQSLGELVTVSGLQISGNDLSLNDEGIKFNDYSNTGYEAGLFDYGSITVNYNNIVGNAVYGVNNVGSGTLDATNNWWGDKRGPSRAMGKAKGLEEVKGDRVSPNVRFAPWLKNSIP